MHCTGVVLALLFWQVVAADYVDVEDEQVEPEPEPLVEAAAADGTVDSESSGLQLGDTLEGGENMHDASQPFSSAKAAVLHPLTADDRSRLESFFQPTLEQRQSTPTTTTTMSSRCRLLPPTLLQQPF